jgi:hypothetical protein
VVPVEKGEAFQEFGRATTSWSSFTPMEFVYPRRTHRQADLSAFNAIKTGSCRAASAKHSLQQDLAIKDRDRHVVHCGLRARLS